MLFKSHKGCNSHKCRYFSVLWSMAQVGMGVVLVDFKLSESFEVSKLWVGLLLLVKEVCLPLVLLESSLLSGCFIFRQQGKPCIQSCRR